MILWKKRLNNYGVSDSIIIFLVFVAIISVVAEIISIGIFLPLFELINQHGSEGLADSNSDVVKYIYGFTSSIGLELTVEILLFLSFMLFLSSKVLLYIANYIQVYYRGLVNKNMKDKLLANYLKVGSSYYDNVSIGDFTNSSSVELLGAVSGAMLPIKLTITIISGVGSIALLLIMSPQLTLISICIVGIGILLPIRWVKATTQAGRKNSHYSSILSSFLLDRLQSARLVRLSNTKNVEKDRYYALTEKQRRSTLNIHLLKARITLVLEPMIIGISLLLFYIALELFKMPVSAILLYMIVMVRIVPIVTNVLTQKQSLNRAVGPIQKIDELLDEMAKSINFCKKNILNKDLINKINTVETLRLEKVGFRYNDQPNNALSNISHTFNAPVLTAIVGPSGSGKTTFVDIICGYRNPTSGLLFINGTNVNKYNPELITSLFSYVPQSPQIFGGVTVYDHISYGRPNTTKEEIINASKLSGAYDFIKELPEEFDTILSGNSSGLSGGQKQRLDLSRALLRNSPIIIMDEPTGNLDLISEKNLMLNIKNIRKVTGKIIIIIAHRVYTIIDADQIIVLENGEVSGVGTHSELLISNSWYKQAIAQL
jgi:ABC-type multidrug transport system fused ATPase/permease subunit